MYNLLMALHIQNPEVDEMVRELTLVTGESITQAVSVSVRERLARVRPMRDRADMVDDVLAIAGRLAKRPFRDTRSEDEILGYGPNGYCE